MTEESIVFMFILGCVTILLALALYFTYKIERGND